MARTKASRIKAKGGAKGRSRANSDADHDVFDAEDGEGNDSRSGGRASHGSFGEGLIENKQGMLVLATTEGSGSTSDEEIDEEGAFDDNDEELYGDMLHTIYKRGPQAPADSGSDQDSNSDADSDEDEDAGGILLSDMLNNNSANVEEKANKRQKRSEYDSDNDDESMEDDDEEEEGDVSSNDDDKDDYSDEDEDGARRERLLNVAEKAAKSSKKLKRDAARAARDLERTEAGQEGEFNATTTATRNISSLTPSALQLGTLVNSLKDTKGMGNLKKRVENMSRAQVVNAPTSRIVEERAERVVGYEQTKEEVTKWTQQVKATREARTVTFPLQQAGRIKATTNSMTAGFEVSNDLESEIQAVLAASGLDDEKKAMKREQDELESKFSPQEIIMRQKELGRLRALMYYDEKKAKRVKKIKSKMYRKLLKRKKAREDEKEEEMIRETDPDAARALDEEAAVKRAEERMSLRHKHTSRYMRNLIKSRGSNSDDTREIVMESIERGQELRKKMGTLRTEDESSDEEDDDEGKGDADYDEDEEESDSGNKDEPDLFKLKFMQRGRQKRQTQMKDEEEMLRRAVEEGDSDDQADSDADINKKVASDGRMKFRPSGETIGAKNSAGEKGVDVASKRRGKRSKTSGSLAIGTSAGPTVVRADKPMFEVASFDQEAMDETSPSKSTAVRTVIGNKPDAPAVVIKSTDRKRGAVANDDSDDDDEAEQGDASNPWMQEDTTNSKQKKKRGASDSRKRSREEEESNELDMSKVAKLAQSADANGKKQKKDEQDKSVSVPAGMQSQQQILARAFTNAVAEEDFEDEQVSKLEDQAEKQAAKDAKMSGWGDWTGAGVAPKKPSKKAVSLAAAKLVKQAAAIALIKSSKTKHVVVSNRTNKKTEKLMVSAVPYPFKTREQYERSLQTPMGNDWNTLSTFKSNIRPEVVTKMGNIIEPAKLSKSAARGGETAGGKKVPSKAIEKMRQNAKKKQVRAVQRSKRTVKGM